MQDKTLVDARRKAEKAVGDMPDGELKLKAFEVILGRLLSDAPTGLAKRGPAGRSRVGRVGESRNRPGLSPMRSSAAGRIVALRDEGFFAEERSISEIRDGLRGQGWVYPLTSLSGPLQDLVRKRELRRAQVPRGKKKVFKYVIP